MNSALFSMYCISLFLFDTSLGPREAGAATVVIAAMRVVGVGAGKGQEGRMGRRRAPGVEGENEHFVSTVE